MLGGTAMVTCRLIALSALAAVTFAADAAMAQGAFPAPLPGRDATTINPPAAAPLLGIPAPPRTPAAECINGFTPLRQDAEKKGKLIKAAGDRHAAPEEACMLIVSYLEAETRMIKYVEANAQCGIPAQVADQLKAGRKNTEALRMRVCAAADQAQRRGLRLPVGDFPDGNGRY
jgi:hypothetical protein